MKYKESIFEQISEFLEYLGKNGYNEKTREKTNLIEKFGKEKFENVFDFCFNSRLAGYDLPRKIDTIHITQDGIRFLEEHNYKKASYEHNKTTLFLTTFLVLTTIFTAFLGIKLANPILLIIIYGLFAILIIIIFKTNKIIKV